jgi:hypothetical protein
MCVAAGKVALMTLAADTKYSKLAMPKQSSFEIRDP